LGDGFSLYIAGCLLSTVLAFVLTLIFKFDADLKNNEISGAGEMKDPS